MTQVTTDYRPIWGALELDLPGHDAFLLAIPDQSARGIRQLSARVEVFLEMIG